LSGNRPIDVSKIRLIPLEHRGTRVDRRQLAVPLRPGGTLREFLASLPSVLKANALRDVVEAVIGAHRSGRGVIVGVGGHVVKCGLSPLVIEMMRRRVITAVMMNGGASIHDFELAIAGRTSEDVAAALDEGLFGMVEETGRLMLRAIAAGARDGRGMGRSLGELLLAEESEHAELSILAAGARLDVPVLVHTAVGAETIHMHPDVDGAALGETSLRDFQHLVQLCATLADGGCYLNLGSAVVLPEVFLKALNLARNLSRRPIAGITTVDMDMTRHYRPTENVLNRPTRLGGKGISLTGHHEIMVPLLFDLVLAELAP
jgi:hypothetical protein